MKKKIFNALGIMSGTSMDGIDISLIQSDGKSQFIPVLNDYFEFDGELQKILIELRGKIFSKRDLEKFSSEIQEIERKFTLFNCDVIKKILKKTNSPVDLIGFHGQTIFHDSDKKISKQLGDGKLLSQITKRTVVNNFRQEDLINGGEGAPLTPIFHKLISDFMHKKNKINYPLNIINIGGITNITQILNHKVKIDSNLYAYDIGPGNCLIDEWVRKNSNKQYDENGDIANSGTINQLILNQAIENFNFKRFDKSLDTKDFDISFVRGLSLEDGCATLTKFSAYLIANGIQYVDNHNNSFSKTNLVCGGGRKNTFLIKLINEYLTKEKIIEKIDKYDLDGDFIVSQAFAYLSIRSFLKLPISFPDTTRCNYPTVGGIVNSNF